jgi:nucleoside-diphosphate-sugar epimerase
MPHVLIAGCGYVGRVAAKLFADSGWGVTGWVRTNPVAVPGDEGTISLKVVDITDLDAVRSNAVDADVVVHCASSGSDSYRHVYRDGVTNLSACFPAARIIFTSSTSVYPQRDRSLVTEESAAAPDSDNASILREAEEIVLEHDGIVLRVAGIYGPGRSFLLRSTMNGTAVTTDRFVNQVHRDDVASAIFFIAQCQTINPPRIFNVVDDTPAPRAEILAWLSQRLNLRLPTSAGPAEQEEGRSNKRVSNAKLRALGWRLVYPSYREGFDQSVLPALKNCGGRGGATTLCP